MKRRFITLQAYSTIPVGSKDSRHFSAIRSPGPEQLGTGWGYDVPNGWRVVSITPGHHQGDQPWWLVLLEEIGPPGDGGGPHR